MQTRNRLTIKKVTPGYWRTTLRNPPINLYDPGLFAELQVLVDQIEADQELKVIVFDSADPDFFIAHYDVVTGYNIPNVPGAAYVNEWPSFVTRFNNSRVVSIASIRGRTRAA